MKDWKNQYPINTLKGESRREFEDFIDQLISERDKELLERIKNEVPCCGGCPEIEKLILNTK